MIRNEVNSGCPLYTGDGNSRLFWYPPMEDGYYYTPTIWVDGVDSVSASASVSWWQSKLQSMVDARLPVPSPLQMDMEVELGAKADSGTIHVEIVATDTIIYTKLRIRFAIIEDDLMSGVKHYDQVLRDYHLTHLGYSITIAEGDTVNWSENFEIDPTWKLGDCRAVAFVQNGKSPTGGDPPREVVQVIQRPFDPVPPEIVDMTVTLLETDLVLEWSPVVSDTHGYPLEVDLYSIYRDTVPSLGPSAIPFDTTVDTFYVDNSGVVGDTAVHYYYAVTVVAGGKESEYSGMVGEFDRTVETE